MRRSRPQLPADYQWGYNRMMTVDGLFGAGDTIGGTAHKFSSGSFTEMEKGRAAPLENYRVGRNEIVSTNYMTNDQLLNRGRELLTMLKEDMSSMGDEAGRQGLALLHALAVRPRERQMGDGEGARLPHHRLTSCRTRLDAGHK